MNDVRFYRIRRHTRRKLQQNPEAVRDFSILCVALQVDARNSKRSMTAWGQQRRFHDVCSSSAPTLKLAVGADITRLPRCVGSLMSSLLMGCQRRRDFAADCRSKSAARTRARRPPISGAFLLFEPYT